MATPPFDAGFFADMEQHDSAPAPPMRVAADHAEAQRAVPPNPTTDTIRGMIHQQ
jgi:hypothetical protein